MNKPPTMCPTVSMVTLVGSQRCIITQGSEVNDMSRLVLFEQSASGFDISKSGPSAPAFTATMCRRREGLDFRSPSLEPTKTQVSPGLFPNREPSGSVLITCSMAFPTSPEPPVTRITSPLVMIVKELRECVIRWVGP